VVHHLALQRSEVVVAEHRTQNLARRPARLADAPPAGFGASGLRDLGLAWVGVAGHGEDDRFD